MIIRNCEQALRGEGAAEPAAAADGAALQLEGGGGRELGQGKRDLGWDQSVCGCTARAEEHPRLPHSHKHRAATPGAAVTLVQAQGEEG